MPSVHFLFVFLSLLGLSLRVYAQTAEWQDELIEHIDPDQFSQTEYERLMEMIYDLDLQNHYRDTLSDDSLSWRHYLPRQTVILSGDYDIQQKEWDGAVRYDARLKVDKDQWRGGAVYTPRHTSLYASLNRKKGWLRQAVVGHYRLSLGSGLICNQRFSLGKSLAALSFYQKSAPLAVHSSSSDEGYMQGTALRMRVGKHWELTPFASLKEEKSSGNLLFQGGTAIKLKNEWYELGTNILYSSIRNEKSLNTSVDYEVRWMNMHLKGETAFDGAGGWSTIDALQYNMTENWQISAFFRQFSDDFKQLSGKSLSEASSMQGERGCLLWITGILTPRWSIQSWFDWFQFTKPQYNIALPSEGYEFSTKLIYQREQRKQAWKGSVQYRLKAKFKNDKGISEEVAIVPFYRNSLDGQLIWNTTSGIYLKGQIHSRCYWIQNGNGTDLGYAFSQAIGWKRDGSPWRADLQGTWFHTDSYDSRVYLSEQNILYGFSIPMLNGEGLRLTCTLRYQWKPHFTLEAKYAHAEYKEKSHKNHVWLQGITKF